MSIVERVDAEVRFEVPKRKVKDGSYATITYNIPRESIDLKALEDYLFNLRCRGAADDSQVKFEIDRMVWNGKNHLAFVTALTAKANATMDGFSMLPAPTEKPVENKKVDVRLFAASGISLVMFALLLLVVLL